MLQKACSLHYVISLACVTVILSFAAAVAMLLKFQESPLFSFVTNLQVQSPPTFLVIGPSDDCLNLFSAGHEGLAPPQAPGH